MNQRQKQIVVSYLLSVCCCGIFLLSGCTPKDQAVWTKIEEQIGSEDSVDVEMETEPPQPSQLDQAATENITDSKLYIHVCGAVNHPGVYELPSDSRLYEAIQLAGGFREDAQDDYLNLAAQLSDGMKLQVPTREEVEQGLVLQQIDGVQQGREDVDKTIQTGDAATDLVNLNTSDSEQLCTIPGVGKTRAESIITYREKNGAFHQKEDIMKVDGIKEGLYNKIKDFITV